MAVAISYAAICASSGSAAIRMNTLVLYSQEQQHSSSSEAFVGFEKVFGVGELFSEGWKRREIGGVVEVEAWLNGLSCWRSLRVDCGHGRRE